jgi:hypothetical protein
MISPRGTRSQASAVVERTASDDPREHGAEVGVEDIASEPAIAAGRRHHPIEVTQLSFELVEPALRLIPTLRVLHVTQCAQALNDQQ